jgi:hypothetical protein
MTDETDSVTLSSELQPGQREAVEVAKTEPEPILLSQFLGAGSRFRSRTGWARSSRFMAT